MSAPSGILARLARHVTYANVVATIALFLALGTGGAYAANEWTGKNIKNGSLTGADVRNGSLTGADLKDGKVGTVDLATGAVTGDKLAAGAVVAGRIAVAAVGPQQLAADSVTSGHVADGAITSADVANGTLTDADIKDNSVSTFDLADNSVDADEVLDFGLTNQDIGVLFAQVNSDGSLASSSGGVTSSRNGVGQYTVDFGRNVSAGAFIATQGDAGVGGAAGAIMGVSDRNGNIEAVFVTARDADGVFVDRAFQLVVVN